MCFQWIPVTDEKVEAAEGSQQGMEVSDGSEDESEYDASDEGSDGPGGEPALQVASGQHAFVMRGTPPRTPYQFANFPGYAQQPQQPQR